MDVEITSETGLDAVWPEIAGLFRALNEHHLPLTGQRLLPDWEQRARAAFEPLMRSGQSVFFVARRDGEAIGFINGHAFENAGIFQERIGFIDNAYVVPHERGHGTGRRLVEALERWFRAKGADRAELNVVTANEEAVRIWERLGYRPFSERRRKPLT